MRTVLSVVCGFFLWATITAVLMVVFGPVLGLIVAVILFWGQ